MSMTREQAIRHLKRACRKLMEEVEYEPESDTVEYGQDVRRALEEVTDAVYEAAQLSD